jgi:hypothetical protein
MTYGRSTSDAGTSLFAGIEFSQANNIEPNKRAKTDLIV